MIRIFTFLISMTFLFMSTTQAQEIRKCGMTHEEMVELSHRVKAHKRTIKAEGAPRFMETIYVPIQFHIMANSTGFGGVQEITLFQTLCRINQDFADQDIQFYLDGEFNYLNNTPAFEDPSSAAGRLFLANAKNQHFGRVNIFVCLNAGDIANVGTTAGYYTPGNDWIVVRKANVGFSEGTLTHEIAHYLSVMHVFFGWDGNPYDPGMHPNPAPPFSPNGPATENMDRTGSCANCETAGDMLCDTWPDYLLSQFYSNGNCSYNGNIMDPCGEAVEPAKENVMSYFFGCEEVFTEQQKELMATDLNDRLNNTGTIAKSLVPDNKNEIDGSIPFVPLNPAVDELLDFNNIVHLEWEGIPHATQYIVEIDQFVGFNVNPQRFISWYPGATFENLAADDEYFWRVYPFNEYSTCYGWSDTYTFTTGNGTTAVEGISEIEDWQIMPNPLTANQQLTLSFDSNEAIDAQISIVDLTGSTVDQISRVIPAGDHQFELNTQNLSQGIYFVNVQSEQGILTKKLIIGN